MKKANKTNIVTGIFKEETAKFNTDDKGLVNYEIANAIVESMDDVDINKLTKEEVRSMTEKVLEGLSQNVNWFDQVKDIIIDTDEYQKAMGEQLSAEEFAEEEGFYLDEYFEEDEEDYDEDEQIEDLA